MPDKANVPLSLYVHIPWCVQKCPYCDFNSHQQKGEIPESVYIANLLDDLDKDAQQYRINDRPVSTIFIGGGTPSVFSAEGMHSLIAGIKTRINLAENAEITMEANPGTFEQVKFTGYQQAGINRFSLGIQSFGNHHLKRLGRIHDSEQAISAIKTTQALGLRSFNTDLMHGLPEQSTEQALSDLSKSIALQAPHISWYQLTIEPNTQFASRPPELPDDDVLWEIQEQGAALLEASGYQQYEISAYAKPGHQSQHNLNYWRFGDYLGIGCGAHGKITDVNTKQITRTVKIKHPRGYMDLSKPYLYQSSLIEKDDLPFEFFMNRFRLVEACPIDDYEKLTGTAIPANVQQILSKSAEKGLLSITENSFQVTPLGRRYLNSLLSEFVD